MRYDYLASTITTPYFFSYQVSRLFPDEKPDTLKVQLSRFVKKGTLVRLKRGIYLFPDRHVDELILGSILYKPSYISLETALHIYGIIPDIPSTVTSVTSVTPNTFSTPKGTFSYSCIDKKYYFGFKKVITKENGLSYDIAEPEKALLDWMYLRKITTLDAFRVDLGIIDNKKISQYGKTYPEWIARNFHE